MLFNILLFFCGALWIIYLLFLNFERGYEKGLKYGIDKAFRYIRDNDGAINLLYAEYKVKKLLSAVSTKSVREVKYKDGQAYITIIENTLKEKRK
jgi:hypothetical protein